MSYSNKQSRIFGCASLLGLTALAMMALIGWLAGGAYTEAFPRYFNSERWKAADAWSNTRCAMIADLQYRIGVDGKSRSQLVALLGEPTDRFDGPEWAYWPLCPSFMDVWILEVQWKNGRATSVRVRDT
jgi:hypothetical protein